MGRPIRGSWPWGLLSCKQIMSPCMMDRNLLLQPGLKHLGKEEQQDVQNVRWPWREELNGSRENSKILKANHNPFSRCVSVLTVVFSVCVLHWQSAFCPHPLSVHSRPPPSPWCGCPSLAAFRQLFSHCTSQRGWGGKCPPAAGK